MKLILAVLALAFVALSLGPASAVDTSKPLVLAENKAESKKLKRYPGNAKQCEEVCISACQGAIGHNCQANCMCQCTARNDKEQKKCGPVT